MYLMITIHLIQNSEQLHHILATPIPESWIKMQERHRDRPKESKRRKQIKQIILILDVEQTTKVYQLRIIHHFSYLIPCPYQ